MMKLLKNTLLILVLFAIESVSARIGTSARPTVAPGKPATKMTPGSTTPETSPAPALPKKQFSFLLADIRGMNQKNVINASGDFTDSFINTIQSSGLAPELTRTLLEAGVNLYLPLSGKDGADKDLMAKVNQQIDTLMKSYAPDIKQASEFLNLATIDKTADQIRSMTGQLQKDLLDDYGVNNNESKKMIDAIIQQKQKPLPNPKKSVQPKEGALPEWYDAKTNLLNEALLKNKIKNYIDSQKTTSIWDMLKELGRLQLVTEEVYNQLQREEIVYKWATLFEANTKSTPRKDSESRYIQLTDQISKIATAQNLASAKKSELASVTRPTITPTQVEKAIGRMTQSAVMDLKMWLLSNDDYSGAVAHLLMKLKESNPEAAKNASRLDAADVILNALAVLSGGNKFVRTIDENKTLLLEIMGRAEFGQMPLGQL